MSSAAKFILALFSAALLFVPCHPSMGQDTQVDPRKINLGKVTLVDGTPRTFDLGAGKAVTITPTVGFDAVNTYEFVFQDGTQKSPGIRQSAVVGQPVTVTAMGATISLVPEVGVNAPNAPAHSPQNNSTASGASSASKLSDPKSNPSTGDWEAFAKKIRIGMRRAEVERLLQSFSPVPDTNKFQRSATGTITGGSQTFSYRVSEEVQVIVGYDFTGSKPEADAAAFDLTKADNPENRVIAPVEIKRSK